MRDPRTHTAPKVKVAARTGVISRESVLIGLLLSVVSILVLIGSMSGT